MEGKDEQAKNRFWTDEYNNIDKSFVEIERLTSKCSLKGAKLVFVPADFSMLPENDHWETLLRAKAIENQVYIITPNQTKKYLDNKLCYGKFTKIIRKIKNYCQNSSLVAL